MKPIFFLLISLALITTACSAVNQGGGELTVPSEWKLVSFDIAGAETPVVAESTVTLEFAADGQAGGSGGCNSYGATYELQGDTLKITEVISTLMACADEQINQQETQFFNALQGATRLVVSGDSLTIFYEDGQNKLNFARQ